MILSDRVSGLSWGIVAAISVCLLALLGCSQGRKEPQQALNAGNVQPKPSEHKAVPVTVGSPVRRDLAPFEDFAGRLEAVGTGGPRAAALPPKPIAVRFDMGERSYLRYQRMLSDGQVKGAGRPGTVPFCVVCGTKSAAADSRGRFSDRL